MPPRALIALLLLFLAAPLQAATARVEGVRLWEEGGRTRLVFDLSAPATYELTQPAPDLINLSLRGAPFKGRLPGLRQRGMLRDISAEGGHFTLKLAVPVRAKRFTLAPGGGHGHRLVVDLYPATTEPPRASAAVGRAPPASHEETARRSEPKVPAAARVEAAARPQPESPHVATPESRPAAARSQIIAVDAGHGGDDPGAKGAGGVYEKTITLAIAKRLAGQINATPGLKAVLIRDRDIYLPLRQRIARARRHKADLFVSVHADAHPDSDARGSSVYILSERGASNEQSRWLAERENAADLIGGVSLDDKDAMLAKVLLDLSQSATGVASQQVAEQVLRHLRRLGPVHYASVQQAGFAVLKSPDIPSILVETAFITHPGEARRLKSPAEQDRLASAILAGLRGYLDRNARAGVLAAGESAGSASALR
jgi:N-acetylmuramoyl-L-alanine amidase